LLRYGFNGQEKTDEIAGIGNHTTAEFWEYDTRVGRRWNLDPKPQAGESPYSSLRDNPIMRKDADGDSSIFPVLVAKIEQIASRVTVSVGENGVATSNNKGTPGNTLIAPIYGGAQPYGSGWGGGPTEPNSYVEILYDLKYGDDSKQAGLHWMKNKLEQFPSGIKDDAPTAADAIVGGLIADKQLNKSLSLRANAYTGAGVLFGAPLVPSGSRLVNPPPVVAYLGDPYRVIGLSQISIAKVDVTYVKKLSIFAAGTVHNMLLFAQHSTTGNGPVKGIGLVSAAAGVTYKF
jgi:hypothetical protein